MVYLFLQCMNKQGLVIKITFALHTSIFVLEMCSSILQFCPREDLRWKELCLVASHFCKAYNLKKKKNHPALKRVMRLLPADRSIRVYVRF